MIRTVDMDGDGQVSFEDFYRMVRLVLITILTATGLLFPMGRFEMLRIFNPNSLVL